MHGVLEVRKPASIGPFLYLVDVGSANQDRIQNLSEMAGMFVARQELIDQVTSFGAVCYRKEIVSLRLSRHPAKQIEIDSSYKSGVVHGVSGLDRMVHVTMLQSQINDKRGVESKRQSGPSV